MDIELTREEKLAITSLKRLAKRWPDTLWILSSSVARKEMKWEIVKR